MLHKLQEAAVERIMVVHDESLRFYSVLQDYPALMLSQSIIITERIPTPMMKPLKSPYIDWTRELKQPNHAPRPFSKTTSFVRILQMLPLQEQSSEKSAKLAYPLTI